VLWVRGLTMRYPDGKLALADFDLTIAAGELVVVLGGNGSGKTSATALHLTHTLSDGRRDLAQRHQSSRAFGRAAAPGAATAGDDLAARKPSAPAERAKQCCIGRPWPLRRAVDGARRPARSRTLCSV